MSTAAGWYDDPTRAGRLRYWDGSTWTEWVSSDGQTSSDPLPGAPAVAEVGATPVVETPVVETPVVAPVYAATAVQPTPGLVAAPAFGASATAASAARPVSLLTRIGFGIVALAGLVSCFAAGKEASTQGPLTYTFGNDIIGIGIVIALAAIAGAVVPWFWGRVAALGLVAAGIGFLTLVGIGARSGASDFLAELDVSAKTGLKIVMAAALIGIVGIVVALVGMRPSAGVDPAGGPASTSKPVVALVLGIAGVLLFPLGVAGAALGFGALDDITASGGRLGGRGLAVAGIVVGLVAAGLWILGLTLGMFFAQP